MSSKIFPIPHVYPYYSFFENNLSKGYLEGLNWLKKRKNLLQNPLKYFKEFNSIVLFFFNYYSEKAEIKASNAPKISIYAQYIDYHKVIKHFLNSLSIELKNNFNVDSKGFIDSSPFLERGLAFLMSEKGFLGKNGLFYLKGKGSYFFIGELVLSVKSNRDFFEKPFLNYCKNCNRCVESCPTGAVVEPGVIDTRKCISYHTIENRGVIPKDIAEKMDGYIFGCDICQNVCPLNKVKRESEFSDLKIHSGVKNFDLLEFISLSKNQYEKRFKDSALFRANFYQMLRNIYIISEIGYIDYSISKKIYDKFHKKKVIFLQNKELR